MAYWGNISLTTYQKLIYVGITTTNNCYGTEYVVKYLNEFNINITRKD